MRVSVLMSSRKDDAPGIMSSSSSVNALCCAKSSISSASAAGNVVEGLTVVFAGVPDVVGSPELSFCCFFKQFWQSAPELKMILGHSPHFFRSMAPELSPPNFALEEVESGELASAANDALSTSVNLATLCTVSTGAVRAVLILLSDGRNINPPRLAAPFPVVRAGDCFAADPDLGRWG